MTDRVDETGAAYAGSQLQTQLYVNRHVDQLDAAIRSEFPELATAEIQWRSPLAADHYAEYRDNAFLERAELATYAADLKGFWPQGGPHWDALAAVRLADSARPGVLLAEGKSYPGELYGSGCRAKPGSQSRALIARSLASTQRLLGISEKTSSDWCGPLYQSANRLAHVYWLRSLGVRAWLVHLLFVDDPHSPTSAAEWETALEVADIELGLAGIPTDAAAHVLLQSGTRAELQPE